MDGAGDGEGITARRSCSVTSSKSEVSKCGRFGHVAASAKKLSKSSNSNSSGGKKPVFAKSFGYLDADDGCMQGSD